MGDAQQGLAEAIERLGPFGALVAALAGLVVAVFCFFVPGLHFILGPFGPFIGGLVAGHLSGARPIRVLLSAALIALGMAGIAGALTGVAFGDEVEGGLARAAPFIVFAYSGFFGTVGAVIGGLVSGGKRTSRG